MAADDSSGTRPSGPVVLRIKLRYDDVEVMVQRFAANVGKSGLFLPTRSLQPVGAEIKFELRLSDETPVLVGLGRVKAANPPDPEHPGAAFGMAVELMRVTPQSRALILRILERRKEAGLPELGLPLASDIDAARRAEALRAGNRDPGSGPVPTVTPAASSPGLLMAASSSPGIAAPPISSPSIEIPPGEALLTAPRRTTGPMAVAKITSITPLSPEPPRKRRMALSEVIDSASGPMASAAAPELDDEIDVGAAIARARALAGSALDAELDALCDIAATPIEISIDAASAELARQLGGTSVRRDRTAGWAPPPATVALPAPQDLADAARDEVADVEATPLPAADAEAAPLPAADVESAPVLPPAPLPDSSLSPALDAAVTIAAEAHLQILAELDSEEQTEMGDMPVAPVADGVPPVIEGVESIAEGVEPDVDGVEAVADGTDLALESDPSADMGLELPEPPLEIGMDELDDFEILAEADADDEELAGSPDEPDDPDDDVEDDVSGLRKTHGRPATAERRSSELDFAARLDLGDDSDHYLAIPSDDFSAHHVIDGLSDEITGEKTGVGGHPQPGDSMLDPHAISAGAALAAFDDDDLDDLAPPLARRTVQPIFEPDPSSSVTLAGIPSGPVDLDAPSSFRGDARQTASVPRRPPGPSRPEPAILRSALSLHEGPVEDYELEHALEALDVDLDDLSIPHAVTQLQRDLPRASRGLEPDRTAAPYNPMFASQSPAPAPQHRSAAPQGHMSASQSRTPAPQNRGAAPESHMSASQSRAPVPESRITAPQGRTPASPSRGPAPTPSRAARQAGYSTPGAGRAVVPRAPSEDGVDIDFDDDD